MKQFVFFLLLCPLLLAAQEKTHRFENDTLYTSCGFKIYKGQTLRFGKTANDFIGFRYISLKNGVQAGSLEDNSVVVKKLSNYGFSPTGSATIIVTAAIVYKDGSKGTISFDLAFDLAIGSRLPGTISELIVPEEFRITKEQAIAINKPAFTDDTLHTSCGYKIFKGQVLQFGKTTGNRGRFRYVNIITDITYHSLENRQLRVKELKAFGISVLGNAYITIIGTLIIKNTDRMDIEIHLAFDHAIENIAGIPSELIVPDEFRNRLKKDPEAEVKRIENLYLNNTITKEEFEAIRKKLLAQ
jgi:hypothetical protein